ncbi:hypothetical protein C7399_13924 [Paraburkholderia tropica]|uniref:Uncharacterized protein n=1 Tax=Paraburkholderia tropica TaxID=92647 RepID=A0ABX5ME97_9BURK|nr:hypothetical protein C7400_13924 [Paraburkholderia tropica]PZW70903.1 hypothetical protein C7399_13924 [Paraburkholderia tropica]
MRTSSTGRMPIDAHRACLPFDPRDTHADFFRSPEQNDAAAQLSGLAMSRRTSSCAIDSAARRASSGVANGPGTAHPSKG